MTRIAIVMLAGVLSACTPSPGTTTDAGLDLEGDAGAVDQLPPEGDAALRAWIDEEHYLDWTCQGSAGPGAPSSIHGRRRICHNDLLAAALAGDDSLPVGAAVVKELYDENDARTGTAVITKIADGDTGAAWYFWERVGDAVTADGRDQLFCTGCHASAEQEGGREMIFVVELQ